MNKLNTLSNAKPPKDGEGLSEFVVSNPLPKAVAALLDNDTSKLTVLNYSNMLKNDPHSSHLAFECHKALMDIKNQCDVSKESYEYYTIGIKGYIEGRGGSHEERIFSAVLDWCSKRGGE